MKHQRQQHVFGPVPSRRLGRSLGVDLVPFKTCSYDCIYCQLGRTTCRTVERKEWVPIEAVLDELKLKLASRPEALRREFRGTYWLEVMLLAGYTETDGRVCGATATLISISSR